MAAVLGTDDLKCQVPGKQRDEKNVEYSCLDASVSLVALPTPIRAEEKARLKDRKGVASTHTAS